MRIGVLGFLLLSCSGAEPTGRLDPEICDDDIDNNGDGLVDCEDETACGGLVCRDPGDTDDTSVEPDAIEIIYDETACCDFSYECPGQDKSIGRFSLINHSTELDAFVDASCGLVGPSLSPIEFQVVGSSQPPVPFLRDADLYADTSIEIEVFFACKPGLNVDFDTLCQVEIENEDDDFELQFPVAAQAAR